MLPPVAFITRPISPPLLDSYIVAPPESAVLPSGLQLFSPPMPAPGYDPASVSLDGLNIIHLPIEEQPVQSLLPVHLDNPAKTAISTSTSSSRSSLSRRRSVSSMTGLMPLTLSTSASNFATPILSEESMEQRVDDYLPELLARDLELGSDAFTARSMTAGAPSYSVVADYMARAKAAGQFTNRLSMAAPYHPASARVRVLGSIEEKDSMVSFLEQQEQQHHHHHHHHNSYPDTSDMDSLSSAGESSGIPPPFRYHRNTSIATAATSFTDSVRKPSPQPTPPPAEPTLSSWIDGDSDEDSDVEEEPSDIVQEPVSPLSPRPPTPPTSVDNDLFPEDYEQSTATSRARILHKKSYSATGAPSIRSSMASPLPSHRVLRMTPSKRPSAETTSSSQNYEDDCVRVAPLALSPGKPKLRISPPPVPQKHHERLLRISAESLPRQPKTEALLRQQERLVDSPPPSEGYPSAEDIEDDSLYGDYVDRSWHDQSTDLSRATPPASPHRNFVTLAHSAKPYVPNFLGEELARVVPLPPDVVETLRVSVACFPETMLLSSSLTVDTIRSYSKKMRHPDVDLGRVSPPPSPVSGGRKSLWRKVNPLRRGSLTSLRASDMSSINESKSGNIGSSSVDSRKAWGAIQNVFGTCSEYICDALYAHILAYNYVSALLARSSSSSAASSADASQSGRTRSRMGGRSSPDNNNNNNNNNNQQDDIPKKAASLLGLGGLGTDPMAARSNSLLNRRTSTGTSTGAPWSRDELLPSHPAAMPAGNDAPVRIVQEGLYKCIVRLIGTARLMALSGRLDEPVTNFDGTDSDVLFMRSLCEIVRLVEETS